MQDGQDSGVQHKELQGAQGCDAGPLFEILVEDESGKRTLDFLVSAIIGAQDTLQCKGRDNSPQVLGRQ